MHTRPILAAGALLAFLVPTASWAASSRTLSILQGSTMVAPRSYAAWRVSTEERLDGRARIVGHLATRGGRNGRVAVAILTEADFAGWRRGYATTPLYLSGEVARAHVRAELPRPGVYYVVISNLFSAGAPKTVSGSLDLEWSPGAPSPTTPVTSPRREDYRRDLLSFGAVLLLAGVLALWSIQRPPATEPAPSEKKIA